MWVRNKLHCFYIERAIVLRFGVHQIVMSSFSSGFLRIALQHKTEMALTPGLGGWERKRNGH